MVCIISVTILSDIKIKSGFSDMLTGGKNLFEKKRQSFWGPRLEYSFFIGQVYGNTMFLLPSTGYDPF